MPRGEFKLARHIGGRGHFGWVVADVEPDDSGTDIVLLPTAEIYANGQRIAHERAQDWVEAVLQGCRDAVEFARQHDVAGPFHVEVVRIDGLIVDTLNEHLRIAAMAAVLRAMPTELGAVDVTLERGVWSVRAD